MSEPVSRRPAAWAAHGLILGLAVATAAPAAETDPWDAADARWRQGPVKYLLTKEEDQAYRKLKTDDERGRFVEEFWSRRDPIPGTPDNEYRLEFYKRAREAASRFTEDGGRGWQDDRGRVFILLGPPDETSESSSLFESTERAPAPGPGGAGGAAGGAGPFGGPGERQESPIKTFKFIYRHDPLNGKPQRVEITFVSEVTGGYRLKDKIDWNNPILKGLAHAARPAPPVPPPAPTPAPAASAAPATPPAPPESTPQSELMAQVRASPGAASVIPLDVTTNFYKAGDKSTFATLTLEVKKSSLPDGADPAGLVIAAEVTDPQTGESVQRFFRKEHFGAFEGNASAETLLFQADRPMRPGKYRIELAVKDPASGALGRLERDLDVPSYEADGLSLSTVTLAREVNPVGAPPTDAGPVPFVLGNFTVVPRPDNLYDQGEDLTFYYQVYGAAIDPNAGGPRIDLSYTFEKKVGDQWRMVGGRPVVTPAQTALVQAYSLPLSRWPGGEYRVSIRVTDTVAGTTAAAEVPFVIKAPDRAPASKAKSKG